MALGSSHKIEVFQTLKAISAKAWNALCPEDFPFADYLFLLTLETSGSVGEKSGWLPLYITLWNEKKLEGALYLYLKNNSYGEYIFDWEWVRAYHENGVLYYPKLVSAVPFTPATGPKLLIHPAADQSKCTRLLIQSALDLMLKTKSQSLHFLFAQKKEIEVFTSQGLMERHSVQYHWMNRGYKSFVDFVEAMKTKKGKQILKEREKLREVGVEIKTLTGESLTPVHALQMYQFYLTTIEKMRAIPYLTKEFFLTIFEKFSDRILFLLAFKENKPVAGSLSYFKGKALFGRYWGTTEEIRNLHFELCYYSLIEYAIEQKMQRFEAGAQGEHKIQRGFLPEITYSAHAIRHPVFKDAIRDFLEREKHVVQETRLEILRHSPYKAPNN